VNALNRDVPGGIEALLIGGDETVTISKVVRCFLMIVIMTTSAVSNARAANDYSIQDVDHVSFNFVRGDSVEIQVTAPSAALAQRAAVKLNGQDVTAVLHADGTGALTGNVVGLKNGDNVLQVFVSKKAKKSAAQLKVTRGITPSVDCASMKGRSIAAADIGLATKGATITDAKLNPSSGPAQTPSAFVPEYCVISGSIAPADTSGPPINFQVDIPTVWNQKSFHNGGGGVNGFIPPVVTKPARNPSQTAPPDSPSVLAEGYGIFGSDSGHQFPPFGRGRGGPGGPPQLPPDPKVIAAANAWIVNDEAWNNFSYEQLKKTHDAVMHVMSMMYGTKSKLTYFNGASQGGREGLEVVSRYPDDYDGVLVDVPLTYFAGLLFDPTVKGVSQLAPGTWVPPAKSPAIAAEIVRLCDSLDGLKDGVINNYLVCDRKLDPEITPNPLANIRCPNGMDTGNDCLSDEQIATVNSFHAEERFGYALANGESDWPGWGTGMEGAPGPFGWLLSATQPDVNNPSSFNGGQGAAVQRGRFGGSQDFNLLTLNFASFQKQIQALSDKLDVREDWSGFFKRKGKIIIVTGGSDYVSNPRAQMRLYDRVVAHSGQATVDQFVRYYVSPNVGHGLSGASANGVPVPDVENTLFYLQDWVENGISPPDPIIQTHLDNTPAHVVLASRPLCRYPKYPRYNGSGDANAAISYTCVLP
jgi:feruloyl esterase